MTRYNKATISALSGAIVTVFAYYLGWPAEIQGAVGTILTTLGVWAVPNFD